MIPNGRPSTSKVPDVKHRSASNTIHDRSASGPQFATANNGKVARTQNMPPPSNAGASHLSASNGGGIPPFASPYGASPSSASAKESFLNYFFGGSEMNPGNSRAGPGSLPDFGGRGERGDNPLSGRRGLEGNAAAFDMKSLDKHLEAVRALNLGGASWRLTCRAGVTTYRGP